MMKHKRCIRTLRRRSAQKTRTDTRILRRRNTQKTRTGTSARGRTPRGKVMRLTCRANGKKNIGGKELMELLTNTSQTELNASGIRIGVTDMQKIVDYINKNKALKSLNI